MPNNNPTPLEQLQKPVYLGDGLYAEFDGWQVSLYAHNGISAIQRVYLEPEVLKAFLRYVGDLKAGINATL